MFYPILNAIKRTQLKTDTFLGYNHNLKISDGEWYDTGNISCDYYPVMSPRNKRGYMTGMLNNPAGLSGRDSLVYIDGTKIVYGSTEISLNLSTDSSGKMKQIVNMGAYLLVFPDKKYVNTKNLSDYGSLELTNTSTANVEASLCTKEAAALSYTSSSSAPSAPSDGTYWYDTGNNVLKQYSSSSAMWNQVATTYTKIASTGIGTGLKAGDGITVSGFTATGSDGLNGNFIVQAADTGYIVITALVGSLITETGTVSVKREIPDMDFVIENNNRLWGCYYGYKNGVPVNEIYASKLGDPFNWNCFEGVSTDSYSASLGTEGSFTGAVSYLGYPYFFKENCIHKIYGTMPSNFQIITNNCRGVQKGSENSVCIVNEVLFYKSADHVCAFSGGQPAAISKSLGNEEYEKAVAGFLKDKYYISMKNKKDGKYSLFVFDTSRNLWCREDDTEVYIFAHCNNELYYLDKDKRIKTVGGTYDNSLDDKTEDDFEWYAESGNIGYSDPNNKYISRFNIRLSLEENAYCDIYIKYDSLGEWEHQGNIHYTGLDAHTVPVRPKRCDHFKVMLKGKGQCKVYLLAKIYEQGGDM